MRGRGVNRFAALFAVSAVSVFVALSSAAALPVILMLLPALLLLAVLITGTYVGEERLARWRERRCTSRARQRCLPPFAPVRRRPRAASWARLLLACSRAGRAPPRALLAV